MRFGFRLPATALLAAFVSGGSVRAEQLLWPDTPVSRLEALALLETLNADLLSHDSATLTLDRWCGAHRLANPPHVVAERIKGADKDATAEQRQRLSVTTAEPIRYRRVRLTCGSRVLSEADNWYVPGRLTAEMNRILDTTDTAFGRAVQALHFQRHTLAAELLWQPLPLGWEMGDPRARTDRRIAGRARSCAAAQGRADPAGRHPIQRSGRDLYGRGARFPSPAASSMSI